MEDTSLTAPSTAPSATTTPTWRYNIYTVNSIYTVSTQYLHIIYTDMQVPLLDSEVPGDKILLRDILNNFMKEQHPYQALDDMSVNNQNCTTF